MPATVDHAPIPTNVILLGLRAAGKSTVGPALARRMGRTFVELDERTCEAVGHATPAAALGAVGVGAFRAAEVAALKGALVGRGQVIALGGGTPTAPGAAELLADARARGMAVLIYIRLSVPILRSRLAATHLGDRPSLTGRGAIEEVDVLFAQRDPLYRSLADHGVEADGLSPTQLTDRIVAMLG